MQDKIVIVPCFNEFDRLPINDFYAFLESGQKSFNLMFVNDGSTDKTKSLLEEIRLKFPEQVGVLNLENNVGKAEAVRQGFLKAFDDNFDIIGFMDADLSVPIEEIKKIVDIMEQTPSLNIVMGSRIKRLGSHIERSEFRHILGRIFSTFASLILKLGVYDTQCGAKVFRREMVADIFKDSFITSWLFDVELLARYKRKFGEKHCYSSVYEYPLGTWVEVGGSKLRLKHYFMVPFQLVKIWRKYH
jgi:dolichyl-phosphate beta-glucosyltransferase